MVFNRFWRADPARVRSIGGTGLGLPIALEDARLHGGWLQAWGSPGDGAHFRLTLPRSLGVEIKSSPLPLEPADASTRRRMPLSVGAGVPSQGPGRGATDAARRRLAPVLLAGAALLLAGCSQIPTSGPIERGDEVRAVVDEPAVRVLPRDPVAGQTQREVVAGFLEASASFENDHEVARRFLTPEAAAEWNANAGVTVIDDSPDYRLQRVPGGVQLEAQQVARISADGALAPTGEVEHPAELRAGPGGRRLANHRPAPRTDP